MRLLITGAWQGAQDNIDKLNKSGHETVFLQWEKDALPCAYDWPEGIIGNGIFLYHDIAKFTNLKYIQLTSAGYDRVPMEYVKTHGIEIHNARGVYSIPMAEFAIGGVLQLYKQYQNFTASQKAHQWNKIRMIREMNGSTVCIVGCGSVGTECAKRFKAFGCKIIGVDLFVRQDSFYDNMVPLSEFDSVVTDADILIMTVPLTDETRGLLNRERLLKLKKDAVIVNIARGQVMDYSAFIELKKAERKDLMAVLDVFETEPLDEKSELWDMENVIATPHNSFVGDGNQERLNRVILRNII